ncbi:MAG: cytochrome c oxidase assembly protein [Streptosporangiaceae bacterium]
MSSGIVLAHGGEHLPPLTSSTLLGQWMFTPVATALILVAAVLYTTGVYKVARRHPSHRWPWHRTLSFFVGLAVVAVSLQSAIGVYDDTLFWIHMVQHLLLIMVAPAFLVSGKPVTLLLHASRNPVHRVTKRVIRSWPVTLLTHPLVATAIFCVVIVATHLTSFMNLVVENDLVHEGEHALYLVAGYLFFLPIIGREPIRWRIPYVAKLLLLILSMMADTITGVVLLQSKHVLFPAYAEQHRTWGPGLVQDLHWGGAVMWIGGDVLMLTLGLLVFVIWAFDPRSPLGTGSWLEQVRRTTITDHIQSATGGAAPAVASNGRRDETIDDDDEQLAAYNAYLAALAEQEERQRTVGPPGTRPR